MTRSFVLYRILGNDIPPRHSENQTEENLRFILENEAPFKHCEKRFLLNRIFSKEKQETYKRMLDKAGYKYDSILFDKEEYNLQENPIERIRYTCNINAARNFAIEKGLENADYALAFDGQTMFTESGWQDFLGTVEENPEMAFFVVPMHRVKSNEEITSQETPPSFQEKFVETEPQIVFSKKSDIRFNPLLAYGQADKVELLLRIGVEGFWNKMNVDFIRQQIEETLSSFYGQHKSAGYIFRLYSGNQQADENIVVRSRTRYDGIFQIVENLDKEFFPSSLAKLKDLDNKKWEEEVKPLAAMRSLSHDVFCHLIKSPEQQLRLRVAEVVKNMGIDNKELFQAFSEQREKEDDNLTKSRIEDALYKTYIYKMETFYDHAALDYTPKFKDIKHFDAVEARDIREILLKETPILTEKLYQYGHPELRGYREEYSFQIQEENFPKALELIKNYLNLGESSIEECPACLSPVQGAEECPDCGLYLGGGEDVEHPFVNFLSSLDDAKS